VTDSCDMQRCRLCYGFVVVANLCCWHLGCWLGISWSMYIHPMFAACVLWGPGMLLGLAPGGQVVPVQQWRALDRVCVGVVVL
jgi:hypothetical protein